jgi:aconitate hydratase
LTDSILPAGTRVLPFRSNIHELSKFTFAQIDDTFYERAMKHKETGSFVLGGINYGQGSSREHAALCPRFLGVRAVLVKSFARIHWQNLNNFGIVPLEFNDPDDYDKISRDDYLMVEDIRKQILNPSEIRVINKSRNETYKMHHSMTPRQIEMVLAGSLISIFRKKYRRDKAEIKI